MLTFSLAALALMGFSPQVPSMGDAATIDAIIREGKDRSQVMKKLTELCTKIGPRLTGSPQLNAGNQWAMAEFRKMGLKNVHLDEWGEVPVGFSRGPVQVARMVAPFASDMVFTTNCWTNGTNGIVKAEAIVCPESVEAIEAARDSLRGKWVVLAPPVPTTQSGGGSSAGAPPQRPVNPQTELIVALNKLPIAGIVKGSRNELVLTGGRWEGKTYENHPGLPEILVRKSDCDRITSTLNFNQKVVLEIGADNRWHPGPVKQYNVVADIPGTEKPDEVVIVSGHFDSWNGPGSVGACDNGTGTTTAMEAARLLMKAKAKPKRTIRFILWTGEEQGLFGSRAYVKNHPNELPNISAMLVDDGGTNYQGGYAGIASQKEIMEAAFAPVVRAFPEMPQVFRVGERMPRGGGSDHQPFNAVGVPGFFTFETGRSNYTYLHHTQHDNLAQAIPEYLVQSSVNHAVVAYNLACLPGLLPREVLPPTPPAG